MPYDAAKEDIDLVHVHQHRIVALPLLPNVSEEAAEVFHPRDALLPARGWSAVGGFAEGQDADVLRECMRTLIETNDDDRLALPCELLEPAMEESQDGIVAVHFLCYDQ